MHLNRTTHFLLASLLFLAIYVICKSTFALVTIPNRNPFEIVHDITVSPNHFEQIKSVWIPVYFAKEQNIVPFLSDKSLLLLSPQGKMHYDARTNQIWVQDDEKHIANIQSLIRHLDKSGPQFLIKARVVILDQHYQKELGVLFGTQRKINISSETLNMDVPSTTTAFGQFTFTIAKLSENNLLNMQISALEQEGHATLVSSPALTTLNNEPAVIESGEAVPYEAATSSGATSVSFKKAVLRLQVTPTMIPHHGVLLRIALNQDKVSTLTVKGVPAIQTQQISTQVILKNGQTIVLGGILEENDVMQKTGIPGLMHFPLLGKLFTQQTHQTTQQELLIFITPVLI